MAEVDLHLHTTFSDGRLTPTQLVELCAARGLKVIAISDHDSTEGLPEALAAAGKAADLSVIPAIELSTDVPGSEIHLLGYHVDWQDSSFQATLRGLRDGREGRARRMVEKLHGLGVKISWDRVQELSGGGAIGRPHVAQAMVEAGYIRYPREAFDTYIGRNGPAYVERVKLTPDEAVEMIVAYNGLPVMAHPTFSEAKSERGDVVDLSEILWDLKKSGLVGMEVYYGDYTEKVVERLAGIAESLGLLPCGGSDYHASGNPGEPEPGSVGPPLRIVDELDALRRERMARP